MADKKYERGGKYPTDRSITDFICCIIFLAATGFAIFLAIYGFSKGNLKNIMQPYDSSGKPCGKDGKEDYKYLYLTTVNPKEWTKKNACVKNCPESSESSVECSTNGQITDCGQLPSEKTYAFGGRFCIRTETMASTAEAGASVAASQNGWSGKFANFKNEAYGDVLDAWKIFLVSIVVAILISLLYLKLLELCARVIIIAMVIAMIVAVGLLGWMFYKNYQDLQNDNNPQNDSEKTYLYLAYGTWAVAAILLCCFCCFYSQIDLAAQIIGATADYITDYPIIIVVPIITLVMLIAYLVWWGYSGAYIFSMGELKYNGSYPWGEVKWTKQQK